MVITDIIIRRLFEDPETALRAIVSVTLDDEFVVHDVKVIAGKDGLFVAMPSRKTDTRYQDIAHPIKTEIRKMLKNAILDEYRNEMARRKAAAPNTSDMPTSQQISDGERKENENV